MSAPPAIPQTLREAINRRCYECVYDEVQPGRWRQQVARCGAPHCELYAVRPQPRRKPPE